jgi:hypothetical protein
MVKDISVQYGVDCCAIFAVGAYRIINHITHRHLPYCKSSDRKPI